MKNFSTLVAGVLWMGAMLGAAQAEGVPRIQFDQTVYDFGKTSQVATISGVFKFKNVGDGVLKIEPPKPTCGCTIARVKSDTLQPGESGELPFTLNLGLYRARMEKLITVKSNDPKTPEVVLTLKVEYTPLYDVSPTALSPNIPMGGKSTNEIATIVRTDGKPLGALKFIASTPWITAMIEPGSKVDAATARVRLEIQPDGLPRRFNEMVNVYTADQTNTPVSTIFLYGTIRGDLTLSSESLYWSVTDPAKLRIERPEDFLTKRVTIRSASEKKFELKNLQSTIEGIDVQLVPKKPGTEYELIAKLNDVPEQTLGGDVTVETSVATQPKIVLPVIVNIYKP